jgi:homopolymeric O-antigen transport system ATP-binding protein
MPSNVAVRIENVSKKFRIRHRASGDGLRHALQEAALRPIKLAGDKIREWRNPGRSINGDVVTRQIQRNTEEEFWAVKNISFEITKGEVVGIIGRNGAGKSTLLKILSRITEPTEGRIGIKGRVASLLEVGTGFHPELTGRENIFLNGAILGMTRREIKARFDEIVDFAGIEKFVDTPVKRYSSGMYVRLAFAVAAHLEPEILVVDEVLAVGDSEFQKKCLGKMREVASGGGRTVFFVSHQLASVVALCSRTCLLDHGRLVADGESRSVVELYQKQSPILSDSSSAGLAAKRPGRGSMRFEFVRPEQTIFEPAAEKIFTVRILTNDVNEAPCHAALAIFNEDYQQLFVVDTRTGGTVLNPGEPIELSFVLRSPWLRPGEYRIDAFLWNAGVIDKWEDACRFGVSSSLPYPGAIHENSINTSVVLPDFSIATAHTKTTN